MAKTALDAIDRKILKYLIKNARMPFLEIARECGISGAAIHQRIRKLDESGVILGSRLIVDPKMMGFDVCAHISITLKDLFRRRDDAAAAAGRDAQAALGTGFLFCRKQRSTFAVT